MGEGGWGKIAVRGVTVAAQCTFFDIGGVWFGLGFGLDLNWTGLELDWT